MEELYYVNGGKFGRTWKQLLYWCYKTISSTDSYWDAKDGEYKYHVHPSLKGRLRVNYFFKDFGHNENDAEYIPGTIRYDFRTKEYIRTVGHYEPKKWQVTDMYGRIIPSGLIKAEYLRYTPNAEDDIKPVHRSWWRGRYYSTNWEFRRDPIPHTGSRRKWCGRRYEGDHAGLGNECRQDSIFVAELRDIKEECDVDVKFNRGRAKEVWSLYTDWDEFHWHNKGVGWKRTRKKKQWM